MEETKTENETNQISKYNDGWLSIQRLHDSWVLCKSFIRQGLFSKWKTELDMIWLELYNDVERKDTKKIIVEENEKLMKAVSESKTKTTLYFSLMARHEFLRGIQDKAGKGGKYIDEDYQDFD